MSEIRDNNYNFGNMEHCYGGGSLYERRQRIR